MHDRIPTGPAARNFHVDLVDQNNGIPDRHSDQGQYA